jgi:hypothetical protein
MNDAAELLNRLGGCGPLVIMSDAAALAGVSRVRALQLVVSGRWHFVRVNGGRYVVLSSVASYVSSRDKSRVRTGPARLLQR